MRDERREKSAEARQALPRLRTKPSALDYGIYKYTCCCISSPALVSTCARSRNSQRDSAMGDGVAARRGEAFSRQDSLLAAGWHWTHRRYNSSPRPIPSLFRRPAFLVVALRHVGFVAGLGAARNVAETAQQIRPIRMQGQLLKELDLGRRAQEPMVDADCVYERTRVVSMRRGDLGSNPAKNSQ